MSPKRLTAYMEHNLVERSVFIHRSFSVGENGLTNLAQPSHDWKEYTRGSIGLPGGEEITTAKCAWWAPNQSFRCASTRYGVRPVQIVPLQSRCGPGTPNHMNRGVSVLFLYSICYHPVGVITNRACGRSTDWASEEVGELIGLMDKVGDNTNLM